MTEERERWMTVAEVAEYLQLSQSKIYKLAQAGEIPCSKVAGQWRFKRAAIDAWMETRRQDDGASGKGDGP